MVRLHRGFTLVELVVFIVVSAIALVGVFAMYGVAMAKSADAIVARQAQEAAYSLLEEIQAMPFTYCDASDPSAAAATSVAECATPQGLAPASGKSRGSLTAPYSNVGDYGGYSQIGIADINGNPVAGLGGYKFSVALSQAAVSGIASGDAVRIDVTVTGPSGPQTVTGYRMRHSPNALP